MRDLFGTEAPTLLWEQNNYDRQTRVSRKVPGGARGEWHEYSVTVRGAQVALDIDGRLHHEARFGGLPLTGVLLWSGMRAIGQMQADWFQYEEEADGEWRVVAREDFGGELGEDWELYRGTPPEQVLLAEGFVRVDDPDGKLYGIRWRCAKPVANYRIRWRQRLAADMYGGAMIVCEKGDMIHVGVGQVGAGSALFTNPRSFAPKATNLAELVGWLGK